MAVSLPPPVRSSTRPSPGNTVPFCGPLEDRIAIRELINGYSDAVFRRDQQAYLACWSDEGVRVGQGLEVRGKAELAQQWRQFWTVLDRMAFFTEIGAIEVDGDRATARCYCREIIVTKAGALWKVVGLYRDLLVRERGAWRFARREYELLIDEGKTSA